MAKVGDIAQALPEIKIRLGGKERKLLYNLYAFAKLQDETGKNIFEGDGFNIRSPRELGAFLWAGLLHEDDSLTIDQVLKMVNLQEVLALPSLVEKGYLASMPVADEQKKSSEKKARRGRPKKEDLAG